jgi:photosystem II stability/assembly factor-like uncharacterized protein
LHFMDGHTRRAWSAIVLVGLIIPESVSAQAWTGNGPYYKNVRAIAQSPANPLLMWAGAFGWGVFKSSDGGATWVDKRTGMANAYVRSLVALSDSTVFAGTNDGIFKSTNGGLTWSLSHATPNSVRSLAYDQSAGAVYAATYGSGLFKSTNEGGTWLAITVRDPVTNQTLTHQRAVAVFAPAGLYVGGSITEIDSGGALFKSLNGGGSWTQVQPGTGVRSTVMSIAISPTTPASTLLIATAALGVYRSTTSGASWSSIDAFTTPNPLRDQQINTVAFSAALYFAGTDSTGNVYYRTVGDTSVGWIAGSGLPGPPRVPDALLVDRTTSSIVYAGTEGSGVHRSLNSGSTWQPWSAGMLGVGARAIRINGNGTILLGTEFGDGVWRSTDLASTWTPADTFGNANSVLALATTSSPSIVYAAAYGTGVYKSLNGGLSWSLTDTTVINHFCRALVAYPTNPSVVYAGTGNGIFRTVNGGTNWSAVGVGIPTGTSIRCLVLDNANPSILYAGTDSSYLYRTTNGGSTWGHFTSANGFLPQDVFIRCITINRTNASIVFAGSDSGRIYRSVNNGSAWTLLSRISTVNSVRSIVQDPNDAGVLFAATFGSGVQVSADGGVHWAPLNTGLPDPEVYTVESDQSNPVNLYAGTYGQGVFRMTYSYVNHAPVLSPIGNRSVFAGQPLVFTISASDSEGTLPALTGLGLQSGAAFVDSGNGRGRFSWTPSSGQVGVSTLTFIASDGALADSEGITVTVFDPSGGLTVNAQVEGGWNLVSVPVRAPDLRKTTLFPGAVSAAFAYQGGYSPRDTLSTGVGYWLKYPAPQTVPLSGQLDLAETVAVAGGWNLIGSVSIEIPISGVTAVSPVVILSPFYGFTAAGGYSEATTIVQGKASWVKVSQPGTLIIRGTLPATSQGKR